MLGKFVKALVLRIINKAIEENDKRMVGRLDGLANSIVDRIAFIHETETRLSSSSNRAPHELFKDIDDDYWLWLNTEGYRKVRTLREVLPSMPPEYFQLAVASLVGDETLKQASSVYKLFRTVIEKHCGSLADRNAVLDFGCGWGRVMRFFMKDMEPARLWGIEMWKEQVEHAKATNKWCNFLHVNKEPPTQLPVGKFDVIFSFSVFSHLSEDSHKRWLAEFKRILAPGGLIIATTWGREHADLLERVRKGEQAVWDEHYNKMILERFPGREKWLSEYDGGHFCHVDLGYTGNEDYGETCIPEEYVRAEWAKSFSILDYIDDRGVCMQNVIVARG